MQVVSQGAMIIKCSYYQDVSKQGFHDHQDRGSDYKGVMIFQRWPTHT